MCKSPVTFRLPLLWVRICSWEILSRLHGHNTRELCWDALIAGIYIPLLASAILEASDDAANKDRLKLKVRPTAGLADDLIQFCRGADRLPKSLSDRFCSSLMQASSVTHSLSFNRCDTGCYSQYTMPSSIQLSRLFCLHVHVCRWDIKTLIAGLLCWQSHNR